MRRSKHERGRPAEAASEVSKAIKTPSILSDLDAMAEQLRGRLVIQVSVDEDRYRTSIYRSAAAAERAVKRARDRGRTAHVTLVQMLPVGVVVGLGGGRDGH